MIRRIFLIAAGLCLGACGPLSQGSTANQLGELVIGGLTGTANAAAPKASVSQEEILASSGKYIRVNISNLERFDTNVQSGENANRVTWVDSSNISVTLEGGVVVATRGLVRDLIAADVSEVVQAIRRGGGEARRVHEFLTNMDGISTEVLQCRIVSEGSDVVERLGTKQNATRIAEDCESETLKFANVYWVNRNGKVIRSLQAISPAAGYLQIDVF